MKDDFSILDFLMEDYSRRILACFLSFFMITLSFHGISFFYVVDVQAGESSSISYSVSFITNENSGQESILVADDSSESLVLSREIVSIDEQTKIGYIEFLVTYSETSGEFLDPCDDVHIEISPSGMIADWSNPNNILSESSSDCEDMILILYVYPNYSGENYSTNESSIEEIQNIWSDISFGSGELTVTIDVNTNSPPTSIVPSIQDDNEEIIVNWTFHIFDFQIDEF